MHAPTITPTRVDAEPITDLELAFGTTRLLPPPEAIPEAFWRGNAYTQLAEALFYGSPLAPLLIAFKPGFDADQMRRIVRSHLASFEPKHPHKIAGVGYLMSLMAVLTPAPVDAAAVRVDKPA
jgi:hypothetical protein